MVCIVYIYYYTQYEHVFLDGLAIDWITDKIYWTDLTRKHVTVADLTGENRTVLFSTDMLKPRGIVVDPTQG